MPQNSDASAGKGDKQPPREGQVQGEGDYVAGRRFQDAERSFAEEGPVEQKAREAAKALDGPEGEELERARLESGEGKIPSKHPRAEHAARRRPPHRREPRQGSRRDVSGQRPGLDLTRRRLERG